MKARLQPKKKLLFFIYLPVFLISLFLGLFYTPLVLALVILFSLIFGLLALLMCLPKWNRQPYGDVNAREDGFRWLGKIVLLQLGMMLIFAGWVEAAKATVPGLQVYNVSQYLSVSFGLGLFPWALYALLASAFLKLASQQKPLVFSELLSAKTQQTNSWKNIAVEMLGRQMVVFSLGLTLFYLVLYLGNRFIHFHDIPLFVEVKIANLILASVFSMVLSIPWIRTLIVYLSRKQISLGLWCLIIAVIMGVLLFVSHVLLLLALQFTNQALRFYLPIPIINAHALPTNFLLLSFAWWIGWSRLVAGFLANLSQGRTPRAIILGCLFLPLCLMLAMSFAKQFNFNFQFISMLNHPTVLVMLSLLLLLGSLFLFQKSAYFVLGSSIDNSQQRAYPRLIAWTGFTRFMIAGCGLFLMGVQFTYLLNTTIMLPALVMLLGCLARFLIML